MIYFDNAASSLQKPKAVIEAVNDCLINYCANPGRSGHKAALSAGHTVYDTRVKIARFFGISDPLRVIFTSGATHSLNLAIKGSLKKGDHVITTTMEHNSVYRPLSRLKEDGVEITILDCTSGGFVDITDIKAAVKSNTKMVICTHVSNVTGIIMPVKKIGDLCRKHGLIFLVDASQSAGVLDIDVTGMNIDLLAVPGHKGLMGMQGIGVLYIGERAEVTELMEGGTGSGSEFITQPKIIPDRYESGTLNLPGIVSLSAGVSFIDSVGLQKIYEHEKILVDLFLEGLKKIPAIIIYGHTSASTAVVSLNLDGYSSSELAFILDDEYGICTRAGLHCAPLAHKSLGTLESAAVRFSFGYYNTEDEVKTCINALNSISG